MQSSFDKTPFVIGMLDTSSGDAVREWRGLSGRVVDRPGHP